MNYVKKIHLPFLKKLMYNKNFKFKMKIKKKNKDVIA